MSAGIKNVPAEDGWAYAALLELAPLLDAGELGWQGRALCQQTDPESFYPEKGGSTREAKRVCRECPVRTECLEYALEHDERFGIWGGLSERERRRLKPRAGETPWSGLRGVSASRSGRFVGRALLDDRRVYVGTFDSPEAAGNAVAEAEAPASQAREKAVA